MDDFDLMAKDYDTDSRIERSKAISVEIRSRIGGGKKLSAIEYGSGTGLVGFQLTDCFESVLFIDSSPGMIEQVKEKLTSLGKSTNSAVCLDFLNDVPHSLRADCIFTSLALHHIKDTDMILSRFYNVLYDSGLLLIAELDRDDGSFHAKHPEFDGYHGFEQSELAEAAEKAGFLNIQCKTFYNGIKTVNGKELPYSLFILEAEKGNLLIL